MSSLSFVLAKLSACVTVVCLQGRALTMAWNDTTTYGDSWFYLIPGDRVLMNYPAESDVYVMPDSVAWDACDFSKAQRV